jgi:hypothetical protein
MPNTWNKVKNEFVSLEMNFLGDILFEEGIRSDLTKVQAIKKWQSLAVVKGIKSIYRLANFFI